MTKIKSEAYPATVAVIFSNLYFFFFGNDSIIFPLAAQ
jgi:hypothetical protein